MTWSKNGTPNTLSSSNTTVNISDLTASEFNVRLFHGFGTGGDVYSLTRLNGNSGSNYGWRRCINGGPESDFGSQQNMAHDPQNTNGLDELGISYWINIDGEEKLMISFWTSSGASGAGTAPSRAEAVGKFNDGSTNPQVTQISVLTTYGGSYDTNSNETALNGDTTLETILGNNVQSGSRFEATDTRKIYYRATPSLTLDENFSSDNWTDNDSTNMGVSSGVLNWNAKRDATNDASVRDLGFVASDKWVLRFKITQGSSIGATQAGNGFFFGISDSDQSVGQSTSQDFVGMAYYYDNQSEYNAMDSDGTALPHLYQGDAGQNITISANNVYYFQIIRNGSSYTVEAFTNSDYSTGSLGKLSGTTTASGLRYLKILNELTNGSIPTSTNPFNGTIDDLKFYNGFTTTTDPEWTEEV